MEALTLIGAPPLLSDNLFERVFAGTIQGLNRVLGTSYVVGKDRLRGPIGKMIAKVRQYHLEGNRYARDWEAFRIGIFAMQMEKMSKTNPAVFSSFRRKVRKISTNEYFGYRFEVQIAMTLIEGEIPFEKCEAPDFEIRLDERFSVFIECVSTNLGQPRDRDVRYKISSAIAKKAKKPYCNKQTALFLDFTNVFYRSVEARNVLNTDLVESMVIENARETSFGAVCACSMINILDKKKYALAFAAVYRAEDADPTFTAFLDNYFANLGSQFHVEVDHMVPYSM